MNTNIIGKAQDAKAWQANADESFKAQDANMAAFVQEYVNAAVATK